MAALVCFGLAFFFTPGAFVPLGIVAAIAGWWMHESARQGVLNTAFVALVAGLMLLVASIALYFIGGL
jgi:hypothetical protein